MVDREVFGDPSVQAALQQVTLLRADVTSSTESQRELMGTMEILGPPTVLLFSPGGSERRDQRLVGEFASADLLNRLSALRDGSATPEAVAMR